MNHPVIAKVEIMTIPTYPEAACEELPMFAENRVHQRSSGNPYPNKVVIKTREKTKIDKDYEVIRLENEFLQLILIPSLGGRVFAEKDKRTGYDFFYRQHVIKPALIGAYGSWISGGLEFNWPFHHRPSTFMPVDYYTEYEEDGTAIVEVYQSGDVFKGKIVWLKNPTEPDGTPAKDSNNPDSKLRSREILGLNMLHGLKKDGGKYLTVTGSVKKILEFERLVIMQSGEKIPVSKIVSIEGELFREIDEGVI